MGHTYVTVSWNRQKRIYDLVLWGGILAFLGLFVGTSFFLFPNITVETALLRAMSTSAFVLLHLILSIGPLSRLNKRFLVLLYNRRHMGVSMFFLAFAHAVLATVQFHAFSDVNPILSIFVTDSTGDFGTSFPFQAFGAFAVIILFLMAATSHDFWLTQFTAPVWKRLHMLVYAAYFFLVVHVAFGILHDLSSPAPSFFLVLGAAWIVTIHLVAGFRERRIDRSLDHDDGFIEVCKVHDIDDNRARIFTISGERVAVFKYNESISAVSNVCQHQNGPLGEGMVIDGLITCPWHGYQYCPRTGIERSVSPRDLSVR